MPRRLEADAFQTQCACLATNMECGAACGCKQASCANRAISRRSSLKLGSDVVESDVWGLDCYTRRNILDGVITNLSTAAQAYSCSCCSLCVHACPDLTQSWKTCSTSARQTACNASGGITGAMMSCLRLRTCSITLIAAPSHHSSHSF